jgi:hypothetical protein
VEASGAHSDWSADKERTCGGEGGGEEQKKKDGTGRVRVWVWCDTWRLLGELEVAISVTAQYS